MPEYRFIEPFDVLYLRGNRLFGGAGDHSEAAMLPWPSLAAGALRTRMLADHEQGFDNFAKGNKISSGPIGDALGTPSEPGSFRVSLFTLGRKAKAGVSICFPMPADLVVQGNPPSCRYLQPTALHRVLQCSYGLKYVPILRVAMPDKPKIGLWLNGEGLEDYLTGEKIDIRHWVESDKLWQSDNRLGIAMDSSRRSAAQGRIYTSETVAMKEDVGFFVGVDGVEGCLPSSGLVRFGGDGRAGAINACSLKMPEPAWDKIEKSGCFKLVLSTPGLFLNGWLPTGAENTEEGFLWTFQGVRARLVASSFGRPEVVSGWDMVTNRPKLALRAVPVGTVYWFEGLQGEVKELKRLVQDGLWDNDLGIIHPQRKAEGFNNVFVAAWH
jgi:CRISPR-associated protein Cmr3